MSLQDAKGLHSLRSKTASGILLHDTLCSLAAVRVYDVRMMRASNTTTPWRSLRHGSQPSWCYYLAPKQYRQQGTYGRSYQVCSVAFDPSGQRLLAGYTGKEIYSFDVRQHACSYAQLTGSQQQQQRYRSGSAHRQRRSAVHGRTSRSNRVAAGAASGARTRPADTAAEVASRQEAMAAYLVARQHAEDNRRQRQQQLQSLQGVGDSGGGAQAAATGSSSGSGRRNVAAHRRSSRQQQAVAAPVSSQAAAAAAGSAGEQQLPADFPVQQQEVSQQQAANNTSASMYEYHALRRQPHSPAQRHGHNAAAADSPLHRPEQLHSATTSSDTDLDSDAGEDSGTGSDIILSAEVHVLGPDGTLLHTARLPLGRAARAAAGDLPRGSRPHSAASADGANLRSDHMQQQEAAQPQAPQHQRQTAMEMPAMPGQPTAPLMLPPTAVMLGLQQGVQEAQRALQLRIAAEAELQRLQQRAAELEAEQARLIRLRDALQQQDSHNAVRQQEPAGDAAPSHIPGQSTSQQGIAVAGPSSSAGAEAAAPVPPLLAPFQQDFMAQLQATAAGFAVPPQQQDRHTASPAEAAAAAGQPGEGFASSGRYSSRGTIGRSSTGVGRRSQRPRRSSRTVILDPAEPAAADVNPGAAVAAAAAAHGPVEEQAPERAARQPRRRRSSNTPAAEAEGGGASGSAVGSRARRRAAGSNMAFMGLDGEVAGNIADISPSVMGRGDAAAVFINGQCQAGAATAGRQRSRLQQQQHEHEQSNRDDDGDKAEPAAKRTRGQQDTAAVNGAATVAEQAAVGEEAPLPFGGLLPQPSQAHSGLTHHSDSAAVPASAAEAPSAAEAASAAAQVVQQPALIPAQGSPTAQAAGSRSHEVLGGSAEFSIVHLVQRPPASPAAAAAAATAPTAGSARDAERSIQPNMPGSRQPHRGLQAPPPPPAQDHQPAEHQRQRQQHRRRRPGLGPMGAADMVFGALMSNIGQAFAAADGEGEIEFEIPIHAVIGSGGRPEGAPAAVAGNGPGTPAAAAGSDADGAAAMIRAELGLPLLSRAQAQQQLQAMQRASRRSSQPAPSPAAHDPAPEAVETKHLRQTIKSEATDREAGPQQAAPQQQQRYGHQQSTQHAQHLQHARSGKRKRSDPAEQQQAPARTAAVTAPVAAVPEDGEDEPPADSDAAFVAALTGRRRSSRLLSARQAVNAEAEETITTAAPAAAAAASEDARQARAQQECQGQDQ